MATTRIIKKTDTSKSRVIKKTINDSAPAAKVAKSVTVLSKFIFCVGRRKESTASVRLFEGTSANNVNGHILKVTPALFTEKQIWNMVAPLRATDKLASLYFTAKTSGGGVSGSVDAIKLALSRALVKYDESLRPILKAQGLMTRDSRIVERKKTGLRKARRAPQFSKR